MKKVLMFIFMFAFIYGSTAFADLKDVQQSGSLKHLGIPYANFVTGAGDGMDVGLVELFARHLGVKYEYVKTDWAEIFGDLTGKKIKPNGNEITIIGNAAVKGDVAANGITVLPWRSKAVNFSVPIFPNQVWLVSRADSPVKPITPSGDIHKDIVAVKKLIQGRSLIGKSNTCLDPSLYGLDREMTKSDILMFEGSLNDIAPALISGKAELTLLDVPDALVALQKWPGKIKIIGPVSQQQDMATAFAKDSPELLAEFNKFIEKIKKDGTYLKIVKQYYPFVFDYFPDFFKK